MPTTLETTGDSTDSSSQTSDTTGPDSETESSSETSEATTDDPGVDPAPTEIDVYTPSEALLINPERGPYRYVVLTDNPDLAAIRAEGITLVYSYVRLDDFRDQPIAPSLLADVQAGLDAARAAGIKVILRFAYNEGPYPDSEPDASLDWVLAHIDQVSPLLTQNADVLAVIQAGFIGAWGEWHTSTNNLLDDKDTVLSALLGAFPPERMTQLRYPVYKQELYGDPLPIDEAYSGSERARVGHHNDCFLASETDFGTYPEGQVEQWKTFVEQDTQFLVMGGETCAVNPPRSECTTALEEFERFHYSFINLDYHPDVVEGWHQGGCYETLHNHLGYRFELTSVERAKQARPGGHHRLVIELDNVGWAATYNPRAVELVLVGSDDIWRTEVDIDPRSWSPGAHHVLEGTLYLPSDAPPGTYDLALALPDPMPTLRMRPEYAIAFTNTPWTDGLNQLGSVELQHDGPGGAVDDQVFGFEHDG